MPAPSSTAEVTNPTSTLPAGPIVFSWYARKNATPRTTSTIPTLLSQSVPNISSMSSDDRNRSKMVGPVSSAANVGAGVRAGDATGILDGVAGGLGGEGGDMTRGASEVLRVTQASAVAGEGVSEGVGGGGTEGCVCTGVVGSVAGTGACAVPVARKSLSSRSRA